MLYEPEFLCLSGLSGLSLSLTGEQSELGVEIGNEARTEHLGWEERRVRDRFALVEVWREGINWFGSSKVSLNVGLSSWLSGSRL